MVRDTLTLDSSAKINVRNLNIWYGDHHAIIDNSMTIRKNNVTALIGPSGCGKSTMAKLIQGLYRPQSAIVGLDNIDLRLLDLSHIRSQVSLVGAESYFFPGTIRENISRPMPNSSMDRITWATKKVFAHGWWTNEGKKISKSLGNTIDPNQIIEKFGLDQLRYFLLREVPLGNDGDFSESSLINRINSDLSNNLGNLIQRVVKFINKNFNNSVPNSLREEADEIKLICQGYEMIKTVKKKMKEFQISKCLEDIFFYIDELNKYMDESQPWNSFKIDPKKAGKDLSILIECFRVIGILLQPFIPNASKKILDILNINNKSRGFDNLNSKNTLMSDHILNKPSPIFPRYEK